jgi:hypothetical protein
MPKFAISASSICTAIVFAASAPLLVSASPAEPLKIENLTEKQAKSLAGLLDGLEAGETRSCVSQRQVRHMRVVSDDIIVFEMRNGRVFVNQPDGGCPKAYRNSLITEQPAGQLCAGEIATVVDFRSGFTAGSCSFGRFVEYTKADSEEAD